MTSRGGVTRREWLAGAAASGLACFGAAGCRRKASGPEQVTVYVSLDEDYSKPILDQFAKDTGIEVAAIYDTEKDKSVGLTQRLLNERRDPTADVFWNNEPINTIWLSRQEVFAPYRSPASEDLPAEFRDPGGLWTGFAALRRVIIYHRDKNDPNKVGGNKPPQTWTEFGAWAGRHYRVAIARPVAGTTATHVAALFAMMTPETAKATLRELKERGVSFAEPSNSAVARQVAAKEYLLGLTDTDDVLEQIKQDKNVGMVFPSGDQPWEKTLILPNTVALVKGAANPGNGRKLVDYLLSRKVEQLLAVGRSAQIPLRAEMEMPKPLAGLRRSDWAVIDFNRAADQREAAAKFVREELSA